MDDHEINLDKGDFHAYPGHGGIAPGDSRSFSLKVPIDFWSAVNRTSGRTELEQFWSGYAQQNISRDDIREFRIYFAGGTTLILKKIP